MRLRILALLAVLALPVLGAPVAHADAQVEADCSADTGHDFSNFTDEGIGKLSDLGLPAGRYALPRTETPTQMVVMMHGHGNDSCSWRRHLLAVAAKGAVAFAPDYTGQTADRIGWKVKEGAADANTIAQSFLTAYPSINQVFLFGISMGGHSSGIAAASGFKRGTGPDAPPLFDYWIDVEGVNDLVQEYFVARAVAPVNAGGALAQQEMEQEFGGSFESNPQAYLDASNVLHAADVAASGIKGVVLVQGVDDGLVPGIQNQEETVALAAAHVPVHTETVTLKGADSEDGTTATAIAAGPVFAALGDTYVSPLAGHGWEGSDTQLVITRGFENLTALMDGYTFPDTLSETVVIGQ